jgi:RNA polymerase sigma-70 factor (ECF subfamily)
VRGGGSAVRSESARDSEPPHTVEQRRQAELDATFEAFCQENLHRVERFLRSQCPERELVDDAVQETFLTTRAKWDVVRHYEKPLGWVYKAARNKLWVQRARRYRNPTVGLDDVPPERLAEPADSRAAQDLLLSWLQRLPTRQAEVFCLAEEEGFTELEIAQILGIAYNTVHTYKQEARQRLRQLAVEAGFVAPAGRSGA